MATADQDDYKKVSIDIILHAYYLLGKGGYVFGSVGLSVCLFVCL